MDQPRRNLEDGKGILFTNTYAKSPKAPKWKGSIKIDGETIKLAGWEITGYTGEQMISLAVDTYVGGPSKSTQPYPREVKSKDDDLDIPF